MMLVMLIHLLGMMLMMMRMVFVEELSVCMCVCVYMYLSESVLVDECVMLPRLINIHSSFLCPYRS